MTFTVDNADLVMYARATTITYLTIAYCQFSNILSRQYEYTSLFSRTFWTNPILLVSVLEAIGLTFLVVYTPYISDFLRFTALSLTDWLYVLGAAGTYLLVFEALKIFKRSKKKTNTWLARSVKHILTIGLVLGKSSP